MDGNGLALTHPHQLEDALIANYGMNTFASFYTGSLDSIEDLADMGDRKRELLLAPRIGMTATVS